MVEQMGGNLHRQARFADATGTRQGEQAHLVLEQQLLDRSEFVLTADKWAAREREVAGGLLTDGQAPRISPRVGSSFSVWVLG